MQKKPISIELANNSIADFAANYSELKRSEQFELFTAFCVLKGFEIEDSTLQSGRVGRGKDGGIDWLYLSINNHVVSLLEPVDTENVTRNSQLELIIGQAKEEEGWKASAGGKFHTTFCDLFENEPSAAVRTYSPDLVTAVQNFLDFWFKVASKKPHLSIKLYQASLGTREPHADVESTMQLAERKISQIFKAPTEHSFLGAQALFDLYSTTPSYDANLRYIEELEKGNDKVALVNIRDYYEFLRDEDGRLNEHFFEDNVRDYEKGVNVNRQILETLKQPENGSDFWWLNNGITLLVSEPPVSSRKEYSLRDVQIVNGLQTSRTIFDWAKSTEGLDSEKRAVLVRIIAPAGEDEKSKIIRATNSQTPVSKASLRATDEIHRRIEDIFKVRGVYYDRRKNYYRNHGKSPREIVSITLLSQAMISAFLMRPDTARARPSSFLDSDETYNLIFGQDRDMDQFYWAAATQKLVDETLSGSACSLAERNNLRFYTLLAMRALGSSRTAGVPLWQAAPCPNDWVPSGSDIFHAAEWVIETARSLQEDGRSIDSVFKGPQLKDALSADWESTFSVWPSGVDPDDI